MNNTSTPAMAIARTNTYRPKTTEDDHIATDYPHRTYVDGPPNPMRRQRAYLDLENLWASEKAKHDEQVSESKDKIVKPVHVEPSTEKHETVKPPTDKAETAKSPAIKSEAIKPPAMMAKNVKLSIEKTEQIEHVKRSIEKIEPINPVTEKIDNFKPRIMRPENIMPPAKERNKTSKLPTKKAESGELGGPRWRLVGDELVNSVSNEKRSEEGRLVKGVMGGGWNDEWMLLHSADEENVSAGFDDEDWEEV